MTQRVSRKIHPMCRRHRRGYAVDFFLSVFLGGGGSPAAEEAEDCFDCLVRREERLDAAAARRSAR